jgi:hypothetical protein
VTGVTFWVATVQVATGVQVSPGVWEATINSRAYPNGSYKATAKATDARGNVGVSTAISFRVAN